LLGTDGLPCKLGVSYLSPSVFTLLKSILETSPAKTRLRLVVIIIRSQTCSCFNGSNFRFYCSRRCNPFMARTRVLISSIDNSVASRYGMLCLLYMASRARNSMSHWRGEAYLLPALRSLRIALRRSASMVRPKSLCLCSTRALGRRRSSKSSSVSG